jgi:hypothetical protein
MKLFNLVCFFLFAVISVWSQSGSASQINKVALETRTEENLYIKDKKVYLYGQQTNGADTRNGQLACAKVVSIILIKAGIKLSLQLGVAGIESNLKDWERIGNKKDLKPGDVVIWVSTIKGNRDCSCTGGGTCHVGIYTEKGYFHNNPLGHSPIFNGIGLLLKYKFKVAYRPPQH